MDILHFHPAHTMIFSAKELFYIAFYQGVRLDDNGFTGLRKDEEYAIKDDRNILEFYNEHKEDDASVLADAVLSNTEFWGEDLTMINGLCEEVTNDLNIIKEHGTDETMSCINKKEIAIKTIEEQMKEAGVVPVVVLSDSKDALCSCNLI